MARAASMAVRASSSIACGSARAGQLPRRGDQFGRHLVGADHAETALLQIADEIAEHGVVAADHGLQDARQQAQRAEVDPQAAEVGPAADRADEDDVARPVRRHQVLDAAELAPLDGSGSGKAFSLSSASPSSPMTSTLRPAAAAALATWNGTLPPAARIASGSPALSGVEVVIVGPARPARQRQRPVAGGTQKIDQRPDGRDVAIGARDRGDALRPRAGGC